MNKENNENEMNGNKDYYEEGADSAAALAPPCLNISERLLQCGQMK